MQHRGLPGPQEQPNTNYKNGNSLNQSTGEAREVSFLVVFLIQIVGLDDFAVRLTSVGGKEGGSSQCSARGAFRVDATADSTACRLDFAAGESSPFWTDGGASCWLIGQQQQ